MPTPHPIPWLPLRAICALAISLALGSGPGAPAGAAETRISQIVDHFGAGGSELQHFSVDVPPSLSPRSAGASAGVMTAETLGEQRTLVSLVNFTNDPSTPWPVGDIHTAILDAGNPSSTASYILEASYGRAWLSGSTNDWVSASYDDSSCNVAQPAGTQQLIDELDPGIDFSTIDRWIIVMPYNATCLFAGVSSLGKWTFDSDEGSVSFSRAIVNGSVSALSALVSHELGHGLKGLQHSVDHECGAVTVGPDCTYVGTDRYAVLGDTNGHGHYAPPDKEALQWFDGDLVDVAAPGGTFLLEPYETTGTGAKALRIAAPTYTGDYSEGRYYYVTYRKPLGFDSLFTELATDGAMLNLDAHFFPEFSTEAVAGSRLLDAHPNTTSQGADSIDVLLEVAETFVDTERGITIEALGVVGGSLEVSVTITQWCGNGVADPAFSEECDGADLAGESCASLGFTNGTLSCTPACSFDTALCGAAQCLSGDRFDEGTQLCTASLPSVGPRDMSVYKNGNDLASARSASFATLLTASRGFLANVQNFSGTTRAIIHRLQIPFDTSVLPDGATIESATLRMKLDEYPDIGNTHPGLADQLVLVQTNDPDPLLREESDFGTFVPLDFPDEGAPRVDIGDALVDYQEFAMPLNATGLSWIDDTGYTLLGLRLGFDVDDLAVGPELQDLRIGIVPTSSPISGPRLEVQYHPLPEPGTALGLFAGGSLLGWLQRRRERRQPGDQTSRPARRSPSWRWSITSSAAKIRAGSRLGFGKRVRSCAMAARASSTRPRRARDAAITGS